MERQRMDTGVERKPPEVVAKLVRVRAYIFTCTYQTTWTLWLDEEEKQGYTYQEIAEHLAKGG